MMNNKIVAIPFIAILLLTFVACAQTKKGTSSKTRKNTTEETATLIQATQQTTLPGRPETPPSTDYLFLIVWKSSSAPSSIFWYGNSAWQACNISKIKNYKPLVVNANGKPHRRNYEISSPRAVNVVANDTLQLYPIQAGKHKMPEEITPVENTIYYKTASTNSKWMSIPVKEITTLPEIVMP